MTILTHEANGGTFSSELPVNARLTFTEVGNPINSLNQDIFDTLFGTGVRAHTPGPADAHNEQFPAGGFFPGVDPQTGRKRLTLEQGLLAQHGVLPAQVPEPSTLLLLGSGLAGLGGMAWSRHRRNHR